VLFALSSGDGSYSVASIHAFFCLTNASASTRRPQSSSANQINTANTMNSTNHDDDKNSSSPTSDVATALATANHARPRPKHIPRHTSENYLDYAVNRDTALRTAVHHLEQELGTHSQISHITLRTDTLTLHPHTSQSKLSAQELSDLQKATHFDKKELQQWYKGETKT
jgi:hypothetical protein